MTSLPTRLFCLLTACILTSFSRAEEPADTLLTLHVDEVDVNADRVSRNASAVSAVHEADASLMRAAGAIQLSDAVKLVGGATVKDYGGVGGLKTVSVRGLGATHTAVACDGILMTDMQTGQTDLGRMTLTGVSTVRLVSGPDNDILQPAAMAASATTLNVASQKPQFVAGRKWNGSATVKLGTYDMDLPLENGLSQVIQADAAVQPGKRTSITGLVEYIGTDGNYPYTQDNGSSSQQMLRENSDVERLKADAMLFHDLANGGSLTVKANIFDSEQGLPANILYNPEAASERIWNNDAFLQGTLKTPLGQRFALLANTRLAASRTVYQNNAVNNIAGMTHDRYLEGELYASAVLLYHITDFLSVSWAEDGRYSALGIRDFYGDDTAADPERFTLNSSLAAKLAVPHFTLTARLNHIATAESAANGPAADNFSRFSPRFAMSWDMLDGLHLRASAGRTYRLPTFNDLYFEQVGRRDLKPEKADMASAGITWEGAGKAVAASVSTDFWLSRVEDRILAVPGKSTAVWMMRNVGSTLVRGAEVQATIAADLGRCHGGFQAAYTYQRSMDKSDPEGSTYNHQLPYTPRHSGSGILFLETPYVSFSVDGFYSGKYYCNSWNGPEYRMPAYYETGCAVWHKFKTGFPYMTVKAEIINLTDCRYELVRNYPMPGRQIRTSLTIDL